MKRILWLAPALLLVGCRSEQVVLTQPAPATASPVVAAQPGFLADTMLTATVAAARPAPVVAAPATQQPTPRPPRRPGQLTSPKTPLLALAKAFSAKPLAQKLAQRLPRRHTTEGTAESGLGGIGLFAIGVVLAILAGLAALVNVIFGVGFFTALGYTAAGLVVLFLLYSLFSGGKKKK
ncbi:MAG: hypothetical protein EOO36_11200 [Cytophagaceae bacterium]|nr:MAG: hypothetical protein EOO36_11200 [Cytophagaceae bacterium]